MVPVESDFTGKARILNSALELFASRGRTGTSLRMVADRARVSPSLVLHHFGKKAGLEAAVMAYVVHSLEDAVHLALDGLKGGGGIEPLVSSISALLQAQPSTSNFIRRSFCDVPDDGVSPLHDQLRAMLRTLLFEMEQRRLVGSAKDRDWRAAQVMVLLFATLVLRPPRRIQQLATEPDELWVDHVSANIFLLEHGVIGSIGDPDSRPDR